MEDRFKKWENLSKEKKCTRCADIFHDKNYFNQTFLRTNSNIKRHVRSPYSGFNLP